MPLDHGAVGHIWGSQWLPVPWNDQSKQMSIAAKEVVVIIIAAAVWGRQWQGKTSVFSVGQTTWQQSL